MSFGIGDLWPRLDRRSGLTSSENFASLRGTVSGRGRSPPEVASLNSPPFEVGCQQRDKGFDVAADGGLECLLDTCGIGSGITDPPIRHGAR